MTDQSSSTANAELLPCPFCGAPAKMLAFYDYDSPVREATIINSIRALGPPDPSDEEFEQGWAACNEAVVGLLAELGISLSTKGKSHDR